MKQKVESLHGFDRDGNPAGGITLATGIDIRWQDGPLGRGAERQEPNGAFVEGVLEAARQRLVFYQTACEGKFACVENAEALSHIGAALDALERRTREREKREVEGTHVP